MKILIVSDSHGLQKELEELFIKYKGYVIIHLGDYSISTSLFDKYNVIYVNGNCDFSNKILEKTIFLDNKRFFLTHGHKYNVKSTYNNIYFKALEEKVDYCLFGHTHHASKFIVDQITFINPGSYRDTLSYVTIEDEEIIFHKG